MRSFLLAAIVLGSPAAAQPALGPPPPNVPGGFPQLGSDGKLPSAVVPCGAGAGLVPCIQADNIEPPETAPRVSSVAALRARTPSTLTAGALIRTLSYAAGSGFGGGLWRWDAASTAADDAGTVVNPAGNAGAGRWLRVMPATGVVTPLMWGADPTGASTSGAAIQAAVNYVVGRGGGHVHLPLGFYTLGSSETISVPGPARITGDGRGLNSGVGYTGGTLIRTSNPTGDVFAVSSRGAVVFRDFAIDASVNKTAGAAISLAGDATTDYNSNSLIEGMYIGTGLYDGIRVKSGINWTVAHNHIQDFRNVGINLTGEGGSNPDGTTGQSHIIGNTVFALNTGANALASIQYNAGGDVEIVGNKLIAGKVGVYLYLTRGPTGTLVITGNSIEQHNVASVRVAQSVAGTAFANLVITGNQLSVLEDGSGIFNTNFQAAIALVNNGGTAWLSNVTVVGNVLNYAVLKGAPLISVGSGAGVVVGHNVLTNLGVGSVWAFDTNGQATKVLLDQNEVHQMPAGIYNTVTSAAVVRDTVNKPTAASLGAWGDGSEVYVPDGTYGSSPLTGGGTGAFARRINGAWRG